MRAEEAQQKVKAEEAQQKMKAEEAKQPRWQEHEGGFGNGYNDNDFFGFGFGTCKKWRAFETTWMAGGSFASTEERVQDSTY